MTITGTSFVNGATVTFDGFAATNVTVVNIDSGFGAAMAAFNSRLAQPVFGVGANNGRQLKQEARFNTALIGATFVVCGSFMVLAALR